MKTIVLLEKNHAEGSLVPRVGAAPPALTQVRGSARQLRWGCALTVERIDAGGGSVNAGARVDAGRARST